MWMKNHQVKNGSIQIGFEKIEEVNSYTYLDQEITMEHTNRKQHDEVILPSTRWSLPSTTQSFKPISLIPPYYQHCYTGVRRGL